MYGERAYPVFVSSGRAGLSLTFKCLELSRDDKIYTFPYASHCVLDAVSRVGRPSSSIQDSSLRLINHQWGYISELKGRDNDIEDAVDTLVDPSGILFPSGGSFEIWSFSKIFGSVGGGVIWCKNEECQTKMRSLRDDSKLSGFHVLARHMGRYNSMIYDLWQSREASKSKASSIFSSEVWRYLDSIENTISDRLKKLQLIGPPSLVKQVMATGRYPVAVPLNVSMDPSRIVSLIESELKTRLIHGSRGKVTYGKDQVENLSRVLLVPIHTNISVLSIEKILDFIEPWRT